MTEMIVNTPDVRYFVDDYDFTFLNGMVMSTTINERAGDTITFLDSVVVVRLSAKPSMNDPKILLPSEDITIYKQHLATQQHRVREIVALNPEQQHAWTQTLKEVSKTVQ